MATSVVCKSLANLSGLFANHCRIVLLRSTQHVGAVQQAFYFSADYPGMPKRPVGSYLLYVNETRPKVVAENPHLRQSDVVKKIAAMWNELPEEEKKNYKLLQEENAKRYREEMQDFKASFSKEEWEEMEKKRKKKLTKKVQMKKKRARKQLMEELGRPKRPAGPVALFAKERHPHTLITEAAKEWKTLSDEEKKVYKEQYVEAYAAYKTLLKEWEEEMISEGHQDVLKPPKKKSDPNPTKSKKK